MKRRPIVILVCVYIVFLIWFLVWHPQIGERFFNWNEKENRLKKQYEGKTKFEGLIVEVQKKQESGRARIRLQDAKEKHETVECTLIYDEDTKGEIQAGRSICLQGRPWWPEAATNPGEWNGKQYARIQKIDFYIRVSDWEYIDKENDRLLYIMGILRRWFGNHIESIWSGEHGEIIKAMLLGETGILDSNTTELFRKGGISHVIAISGLHLSILSEIIEKVLKRFQKPKIIQLEINVFLWLYTVFAGASVSTMRAAIMASIRGTSVILDREEDFLNTLALTAGILLIKQPLYILDAGFTLSFAALLGIKYGSILMMSIQPIPYRIRRLLSSSAAVSIVTMPLSLWFFYEGSVWGVLLNLWVVPAMEVLLMGVLTAIGLSWFHPAFAKGIAYCVDLLLLSFQKGSELISLWPLATLRGKPTMYQMMAFYGLWLLILWYFRKTDKSTIRIRYWILGICLAVIVGVRTNFWRVMYLDVGQGDCAVIEWNRNVFIVDAGPEYETVLKPYLMRRGIREIAGVALSHADWDHMESLLLLSEDEDFMIKRLWVADEVVQENENRKRLEQNVMDDGGVVQRVKAGYCFQTEGFSMKVLAPVDQHEESNEGSLVAEFEIEGWRFLFSGDIGEKTEIELENQWNDVDVLKVAHHGSKNSSAEEFLEAVQPERAVISCGRNNRYGHPHEETIEKLNEYQVEWYVTAECGAIWLEEMKDQLTVQHYGIK